MARQLSSTDQAQQREEMMQLELVQLHPHRYRQRAPARDTSFLLEAGSRPLKT